VDSGKDATGTSGGFEAPLPSLDTGGIQEPGDQGKASDDAYAESGGIYRSFREGLLQQLAMWASRRRWRGRGPHPRSLLVGYDLCSDPWLPAAG